MEQLEHGQAANKPTSAATVDDCTQNDSTCSPVLHCTATAWPPTLCPGASRMVYRFLGVSK